MNEVLSAQLLVLSGGGVGIADGDARRQSGRMFRPCRGWSFFEIGFRWITPPAKIFDASGAGVGVSRMFVPFSEGIARALSGRMPDSTGWKPALPFLSLLRFALLFTKALPILSSESWVDGGALTLEGRLA